MAQVWSPVAAIAAAALVLSVGNAAAERIVGGARAETLRGTAAADRLYGRGGNDRLFGLAGNDLLVGGPGADRLWGGPGRDRMLAGDRKRDVVVCGPGRDHAVVDGRDVVHRSCERTERMPTSPPPPTERSPVALENEKPGSPGWASFPHAPGRAIEGYTAPGAAPGETLAFHVSAEPAADYRILVYRAGWYGGAGARLVACLPSCEGSVPVQTYSIPEPLAGGLVHAGWPESQSLQVGSDWVSGYYLAHFQLTSGPHAGAVATTWFVVREAPSARRAPILVQASLTTWQAYNGWGGYSLYEFNSLDRRRAAKVTFDRPYDDLGQTESWELPLARFLERSGYDVAYQADVDTARDLASLRTRAIVVVAGHSEYWTKGMRDSFEQVRDSGVDLAFFGANAAYWQIRYEDDFRTIVGYKSAAADPETDPWLETDLFRLLVPPRYECELMGIQHQGGDLSWLTDGDYTVTEAAAQDPWLRGAGFHVGDVVRGVVSREVDTIPPHQTAEDSCGKRLTVLFHRELGGDTLGDADAVRYTAASGARVFASGSHQFVWGLEDVPEVHAMGHGLVDERLRTFVRLMLDDMLAR